MMRITLFCLFAWLQPTVRAAYKCAYCITPDASDEPPSNPYCPLNTFAICLDETDGDWNIADAAAKKHVDDVWGALPDGLVPTQDCHAALKTWVCAAHMPVCEASTHGRGVCQTQFLDVTELQCPTIFASNSTTAQQLRNVLDTPGVRNGSVVSDDAGSCFHLDYNGPNYWNWVIGFGLCTIFAALSPLALNLQKRSINQNDALPIHEQKPTWRQTKWILGCCILISGSLVDFVAYGLAPQSLLTPLGSLVLVWNMVVAHYYGEKIGRIEILAMFVIFLGTLLCIISADHYTPNYSFADILNLWYTERMLWYIILVPLSAALHTVPLRYIRLNNLLDHPKYGGVYARVQCICYAGAAGIIGAQAILFAKQTMELLKAWGLGEPVFSHYETYFILLGIPGGLVGNLSFLNAGLRDFDALQVVPIYQTYWMLAGTIGGFVYFDEISEMSDVSKGMFFLGTLISILGIVILSSRAPPVGTRAERYGKLDVTDELDDDSSEDRLGSDPGVDDEVDVELPNRDRANSEVIVRRVAGAFVLTMSDDSDGDSDDKDNQEPFDRYEDEPSDHDDTVGGTGGVEVFEGDSDV
jgi:hypothetical protein